MGHVGVSVCVLVHAVVTWVCVCVCAEACGIHCQPRAESLQSCAPVSMCVGIDVAKSKVCPPGWVRFPVQIFVEIEEHLSSSS